MRCDLYLGSPTATALGFTIVKSFLKGAPGEIQRMMRDKKVFPASYPSPSSSIHPEYAHVAVDTDTADVVHQAYLSSRDLHIAGFAPKLHDYRPDL